ncbi:MAG: PEGA domain-containing protein [Deltaproteobacteria bacterium]|nr:PEGA domain-containing protein [Deltaproteobacteria bacterium]
MLVRMKRVNGAMSAVVLVAFTATLAVGPMPALAQDAVAAGGQDERYVVLFVPIQRSDHVSEGVPGRVEEYLRALVEIDPKIDLLMHAEEAVATPEATPAEPVPEPIRENPRLERARKLADSGRVSVEKRRFESGLGRLMKAESLYGRNLADLEDFDRYIDARLWLAVGFINGGYMEEGRSAIRKLLVMRPELSLDAKTFSKRFMKNLASSRKRIKTGGDLTVSVDVDTASVYVDGRLVGNGAQTVSGLPRGRHYVRVVSEGLPPRGRFVNTKPVGRTASVFLKVTPKTAARPKPAPVKARLASRPLTEYARSGEFESSFESDVRLALGKTRAQYAVLAYLARSDSAFHLGLFLFDGKTGKLADIEPAVIDTDLSNLQIALLDLESRLAKALSSFPSERLVTLRPAIYALAPSAYPEPAPVAVAPEPEPAPVTVTPTPAPEPEPVASGGFDDIPEDFPMDEWPSESPSWPLYQEWWLWTVVGAVVIGGAAVIGVCAAGKCGSGGGGNDAFGARAVW